jgi:26S proteasome regulatory subunit N10
MMTMAGKRPEIFLTQTNDVGRLLSTITKMPIHGYVDLPRAIKIAQLSLKHRQNKNQKQRIIVFVGSPIEGLEDKDMVKLGKQLRKNDVAIDVVNFGHPENIPLLTALVENCSKNANSHMIEVNYGMNIADIIITSSIVAFDGGMEGPMAVDGEGAAPAQPSAGGNFAEYGGIDPNLDPELAMAIRISLEEAKNAGNADGENPTTGGEQPVAGGDVNMEDQNKPPVAVENEMEADEEDDYDAALEEAKKLSMAADGGEEELFNQDADANKADDNLAGVTIDQEFLGELMQDLGVPMDEDAIKNCLEDDEKDEDKDKKKDDEKK